MKDNQDQILAARVPKALIKRLDKAAKEADRTRSAQVRVMLEDGLATVLATKGRTKVAAPAA